MAQSTGYTGSASASGAEAAPMRAKPPTQMADPGAWAVTAFATTSFMLGIYNAGLLHGDSAVVLPAAFFFGGTIQIIVAILEVIRGNLFGAVVFGSYGPFWVIYGALLTWKSYSSGLTSGGVALFLSMFAVLTFYFFVASFRTDAVLVGCSDLSLSDSSFSPSALARTSPTSPRRAAGLPSRSRSWPGITLPVTLSPRRSAARFYRSSRSVDRPDPSGGAAARSALTRGGLTSPAGEWREPTRRAARNREDGQSAAHGCRWLPGDEFDLNSR